MLTLEDNYVWANTSHFTVCAPLSVPQPVYEVYVDDDYNSMTPEWGYDHFDKVQDGIDAVAENGTVYVANGAYCENVLINKRVELIGENKNNTIIDAGGVENVILVTSDMVNITDFTLQNGVNGVEVYGQNCRIENNNLNNLTRNNGHGCYVQYSDNNIFCNNTVGDNNFDGLTIMQSKNNIFQSNIIYDNFAGINLATGSNDNTIKNNEITHNLEGVKIIGDNNKVNNNLIGDQTSAGIRFYSGYNNTIKNNNIFSSLNLGILIEPPSNNNSIYHNNLNNTNNAQDTGYNNNWDIGYPLGGNNWLDYLGNDQFQGPGQNQSGRDGIRDTPYTFFTNQDKLPANESMAIMWRYEC